MHCNLNPGYTDGYVEVFDHNGTKVTGFTNPWLITGANPRGIALIPNGQSIIIADTYSHRILQYSISGTFENEFGVYGNADGQFYYPTCVDVDTDGRIYIGDLGNFRFQIFDSNYNFLGKYTGSQGSGDGQFDAINGISVDTNLNVYTADPTYGNVQKFKKNP